MQHLMEQQNWNNMTYKRPDWDEYFMTIAEAASSRATCDRGRTACIAVVNNQIVATGYVGAPMGIADCDTVGHELNTVKNPDGTVSTHCIRTVHAEQNVIAQAARTGVTLTGATIYCKLAPCYTCAKLIINAGITRVVAASPYQQGGVAVELLKSANVQIDILSDIIKEY